jgi:hypothetical protein
VQGLRSAVALTTAPALCAPSSTGPLSAAADATDATQRRAENEGVYVVSDLDAAVSLFQYDALGASQGSCGLRGCLQYTSTVSDSGVQAGGGGSLLDEDGVRGGSYSIKSLQRAAGLAGARNVKVLPTTAGVCGMGAAAAVDALGACQLVSISGVRPQTHLPCSSVPPLLGAAASAEAMPAPALAQPACVAVEFRVERLPTSKPLLILQEPSLSSSSGLHNINFEVAKHSVGTARYRFTPLSSSTAGARLASCRQDGCCRIEFEHDGQWGTVCDDYWTDANTAVACRTAGCSAQGATAISYAWDIAFDWEDVSTGMIWLDDVQCTGSEARIGDCDHSGWGQHDCTHDEDVGVCCQGVVCPAVSCTLLSLLLNVCCHPLI